MKQEIQTAFLEVRKIQSELQKLRMDFQEKEEVLIRTLVETKSWQFLKPNYPRLAISSH